MNTPTKLLIGLGTIGGASGAGYAIHQQLSTTEEKEDIRKKLISDGYEVLGDNPETWRLILASYSTTVGESKYTDLKFDDFDGKQGTGNKEEILKEKCKNIINSTDLSDSNYRKAKKWCTVPKTFTDILKKQGYTVLSIKDDEDTTDQAHWKKKVEQHNKKSENTEKRFKNLDSGDSATLEDNAESRNKMKKECKALLEKFHYEKEYQEILDKTILWCAIK